VHVSNILAKLGAGSRTEAAAIAHSEGVGVTGWGHGRAHSHGGAARDHETRERAAPGHAAPGS
jgi:hypothetical protein